MKIDAQTYICKETWSSIWDIYPYRQSNKHKQHLLQATNVTSNSPPFLLVAIKCRTVDRPFSFTSHVLGSRYLSIFLSPFLFSLAISSSHSVLNCYGAWIFRRKKRKNKKCKQTISYQFAVLLCHQHTQREWQAAVGAALRSIITMKLPFGALLMQLCVVL